MSNLSDAIENFLKKMIESNSNSFIEIQRNLLAQQFECAPSQINYVLTTRFNNDRGYIIESRRGGGGYVKIVKVDTTSDIHLENILNKSIGDSLTFNKASDLVDVFEEKQIISTREKMIIKSSVNDRALGKMYSEDRNKLRADILKEILLTLLNEKTCK